MSVKSINVIAEGYRKILDEMYDGVYIVDTDRRIVMWNKSAEAITGYSGSEVIGKHCADNILVHVTADGTNLCKNMCPLAKTMSDGTVREADVFLHHKDGHRVPIRVKTLPLTDKNTVVGGLEIFSTKTSIDALAERLTQLEQMAMVDHLTRLVNRRYFEIRLNQQLAELHRYNWGFGMLFIDIDNFKQVNDTYGHEVGDRVLKMIAGTMTSTARPFDVISRWGGEKFAVAIANITQSHLYVVGNRWLNLIRESKLNLDDGKTVSVTISIGATLANIDDSIESLVTRADALMYESKKTGRNRITVG
jgi:diguanylate cyclase (GGDEF)-like protein/PAS domain S-box-containing protein